MKKIFIVLCMCISITVSAQQVSQYSQYLWNSYLINPAIGGAENFMDAKAGYRNQWVGIDGAPVTMYMTMHTQIGKKLINREDNDVISSKTDSRPPSKFANMLGYRKRNHPTAPASFQVKPHHGVGGQIISDKIGPFSTIGVYASYSYHIPITREIYLSMGAFVGIKQYKIDVSKITLSNDNDAAVRYDLKGTAPDGMLGIMMYGNKFYLGASVSQMFYNSFKLSPQYGSYLSNGQLVGHYFLMGGYRIKLSNEFALVPSSIVRYLPATRPSVDLTMKLNYIDILWTGVSVRQGDAIIFLAGFTYKNKLQVGYSYDYTTSSLGKFSGGSHEIVVGFRLINKSTTTCRPSYVW